MTEMIGRKPSSSKRLISSVTLVIEKLLVVDEKTSSTFHVLNFSSMPA